jgi:hypothetical protein
MSEVFSGEEMDLFVKLSGILSLYNVFKTLGVEVLCSQSNPSYVGGPNGMGGRSGTGEWLAGGSTGSETVMLAAHAASSACCACKLAK